jgi:asparagine synthase (glutamine-hydrolysing)
MKIQANARLDARYDLNGSDAELILHAYEKWGDDCVKHLIGDFAFAIWDGRKQRYFCARDHFGVKPFYFTHIDNDFAFSSSLNELRLNPRVSNTLNEIAVGDYLLFGVNQDLSTTIFKDIQRLQPGHTLIVANGSITVKPYWKPEPAETRFRDPSSYVERFSELLSRAVKDRVTTDRVAISMSGGLDSTSLAAIACEQLKDVHGFAVVYDSLIPDEERHYSTLAAEHLGIPVTHLSADRYSLFDEQAPGEMDQPEPFLISPLTGQFNDLLRLCAEFSPVALTGYDGDAFMNVPPPPGVKTRIKRLIGKKRAATEGRPYSWLDESFAKRTHLDERWRRESINQASPFNPIWTALFEGYDPSSTKLNLEVRHPFMDVRLVEFLSSIPVRPWRINKHILRVAMKDQLPAAVLNRRKTPLASDPALQLARRGSVRCVDSFEVSPQLRAFVNLNRRRSLADEETSDGLWANLRIFALNYWLLNSQPVVRRTSQTQVNTVAETKISIA